MVDDRPCPTRRIVLLGASNLTLGMRTVFDTVQQLANEPLDLLVAAGHGRSYGMTSSILGRSLPGILSCDLWSALSERERLPTTALITDIGNDLLYHVSVDVVADWVERCLYRCEAMSARVAMTELPLCNLANLSKGRFLFFRRLFVPNCRLSLADIRERAAALNERLRVLARQHHVTLITQRTEWYGLDPIHLRRSRARDAWRVMLSTLYDEPSPAVARAMHRLPRRWFMPAECTRWNIMQRRAQPCATWNDGAQLSIY